jgi:5-formyltetrahydrofolate cyclo-ligase
MAPTSPSDAAGTGRPALRRRLLAAREAFAADASAAAAAAQVQLAGHLAQILAELEPGLLGAYVSVRGEFNAIAALQRWQPTKLPLALPYAQREPAQMHYRAWDGAPLDAMDECGLPAPATGPPVVPDVVLVPCVGFTRTAYRLGYGGGYFDRWLAAHRGATAIGIAWSLGEVSDAEFARQPHDQALTLVLTERGVVG